MAREPHLTLPIVAELRELRDIARREHGPQGRSTRRIQEALNAVEAEARERRSNGKPAAPSSDR